MAKIRGVCFGEMRFETRGGRVRSGEVHFGLKFRWVRFSGLLLGAKIRGVCFGEVCFGLRVRRGRLSG